jgi:Big-like domain-containing protein
MKWKALLLLAALSQVTCHQALLVAGPGSTMTCFANPTFIPAVRGASVISCLVMDGTGNPVADGTVVQFFTDLGRIPEQGRTNDGVVRVNLESDGRSGQANVTAISGGESTGGGGGSTTTTTTLPVTRGLSASATGAVASLSGIAATGTATVQIGNANAQLILLAASPTRITDVRPATLTATVSDQLGNPIANVPVTFAITSGGSGTESLDSQGQPVFTDTNGQAHDVLRTRFPRDGGIRTVQVTARAANGLPSDPVTVTIN